MTVSMSNEECVQKLLAALAKAQACMEQPKMDSTVHVKGKRSYTFRFASLGECFRVAREAFAKHDLFLNHRVRIERVEHELIDQKGEPYKAICPQVIVVCVITHADGGIYEGGEFSTVVRGWDMQAIGSAVTYLRRYSTHSALAMYAEEDDDGNCAAGNEADLQHDSRPSEPKKVAKKAAPKKAAKPSKAAERKKRFEELKGALSKHLNDEDLETLVDNYKGANTVDGRVDYDKVLDAMALTLKDMEDGQQ